MRKTKRVALVAATGVLVLLAAACSSSKSSGGSSGGGSGGSGSKSQIVIGMSVASTGYLASVDQPTEEGVKMAVDDYNAKGGADGHKLVVKAVDNASTATTGVTVVNQLLNQYKADVLINGALSAQSSAIVPVLAARKVPAFTTSQLPSDDTWEFNGADGYKNVADLQMEFAAKQLHAETIAFLYSQTPYGQLGQAYFPTRAATYGLKVVDSESVDATSTDLSSTMSKVVSTHPDAIIDFLTGAVHVVEAKAAVAVGLSVPLVFAADELATAKAATALYKNTYFLSSPPQVYPNISDPEQLAASKPFVAAYTKLHPDLVGISFAGQGYDSVTAIVDAVTKSHASTGDALRKALESVSLVGVEGPRQYSADDHTGQAKPKTALTISQYVNGAIKISYPTS